MTALFALFLAAAPASSNKLLQGIVGLLVFLVILGIMVLVHEAGHFFMAKACGVRVEAFAIGFGKRLFGVVRNGTDYRVNALPLGGYVKMAGQDEMPDALERAVATPDGTEAAQAAETAREDAALGKPVGSGVEFTAVPRWRRMLIAISGPAANLILAFLVLLAIDLFHYERAEYLNGPAQVDYVAAGSPAANAGLKAGDTFRSFNGQNNPTWQTVLEQSMLNTKRSVPFETVRAGQTVSGSFTIPAMDEPLDLEDRGGLIAREQEAAFGVHAITPDTPAERAGLLAGDRILAVDGVSLHSTDALLAYLRDGNGKTVTLTVQRGEATHTLQVTPAVGDVGNGRKQYRLGFSPERTTFQVVHLPFPEAAKQAAQDGAHASLLVVQVLRGLLTHRVSAKNMSGPVGIEQQVSEAASQGFWTVATLAAEISINLAVFNLLPFPILDGGLLLFLIVESIARRDVKPALKERIYQAAFACIIVFFCFVMWNDISRLFFTNHHS